jgi:hypothetical protein
LNASIAREEEREGIVEPRAAAMGHARYVVSGFRIVILRMPRHVVRKQVANGVR